jgi:UDP-N-acetylmuramoyl-tripeptide--D-alanyl-D-alanine ligase
VSLWTSSEAAAATGGTSTCDWEANGVSIDTRTLVPGDLFVALKDQRDGHEFVADALANGAAAALVSHRPDNVAEDAPLLIVKEVLPALEDLARAARSRTKARIVAITGSVGKTGTKDMLAQCLSQQGRTHAAEKSYNNHWGVPLTLARMPAETEFGVIEIGMNAPGEIAPLSKIARPHVAIITAVEPVHMAAFRNVRGIAREKASIFEGLEPGGTAVLNRDARMYPVLNRKAARVGAKPLRFGFAGRPEYRLRAVKLTDDGTTVRLLMGGRSFLFKLGAPGKHLAMNACGVIAAIEALGADVDRAGLVLSSWQPPAGRGAQWTIGLGDQALDGAITLIDESYNANPASMAAALDVLAATNPRDNVGRVENGRRIAFLGDMLELGEEEAAFHRDLADLESLSSLSTIHVCGPRMRALHEALPRGLRWEWHETSKGLAKRIPRLVDAGDVTMVKGSLGSKMARVVDAIKKLGDPRPLKD